MTIGEVDKNIGKSVQVKDISGDIYTITITKRVTTQVYWQWHPTGGENFCDRKLLTLVINS